MDTLGVWLRETRQEKGASLSEAANRTRIRAHLLEALEAGDFAALSGGEVQVRGFLRIYARYLGLPPEQVLARYDSEAHGKELLPPAEVEEAERPPEPPERMTAEEVVKTRGLPLIGSAPAWFTGGRAVGAAVALTVVAVVILAASGILGGASSDQPEPTGTASVEETYAPTPAGAAATPTPSFPIDPRGVVSVTLEATEHVWVHATSDDSVLIEGMMEPGQIATWSGEQIITVNTGNGAALLITVNNQLLGRMCGRAELCTRAWAPWGEIEPPTAAGTPTAGQ
jgi:cytoskeleton protein RodZ